MNCASLQKTSWVPTENGKGRDQTILPFSVVSRKRRNIKKSGAQIQSIHAVPPARHTPPKAPSKHTANVQSSSPSPATGERRAPLQKNRAPQPAKAELPSRVKTRISGRSFSSRYIPSVPCGAPQTDAPRIQNRTTWSVPNPAGWWDAHP